MTKPYVLVCVPLFQWNGKIVDYWVVGEFYGGDITAHTIDDSVNVHSLHVSFDEAVTVFRQMVEAQP